MTGKPITWAEIEAIFDRCDEIHMSPNLEEQFAAQGIETAKPTRRETGSARRVKARSAKPMRPKDIA
jgi:hypothetical protein